MCRNIKTLFNFDPVASNQEIHDAALQYVRKLSGFHEPSKVNQEAFNHAVEEIAHASRHLIDHLTTTAEHRNREIEAAKARARAIERFGLNKA